ncbi:phosphonoacetaldehyde hydrolase [uncultured Clostridium sp.]|uniref:phosphonoacetaldehyde hydrolase n=1 Tax=uncultured Clostridium sp. TaxID=59620 RepID=UPI0026151F01|nr:phosphonoacetaldehyde hydrolase [uncultured Clostridium sp.]
MRIKGIIFDFAGTTIDYGCFSPVEAFIGAFNSVGIDITIEEAREPMGMLKINHARAIFEMDRVKDLFEEKYKRDYTNLDLYEVYEEFENILFKTLKDFGVINPYVIEEINNLRINGIKIGSTTGYTRKMLDEILPVAKRNGYSPDFTITSDEVENGRPHKDMIVKNAEFFNIKKMNLLVKVGDTIVDILEAKSAGCHSVAIVLGSSELGLTYDEVKNMDKKDLDEKIKLTRKKFIKAGADYVIDDMRGLIGVINKINDKGGIL